MATKQCHKDGGYGQESRIKGFEGWFTAECVANEHHGKIDEIVVTKACSSKPDLVLKSLQATFMSQDLSSHPQFSHPGRGGGNGLWSDLYSYGRWRHSDSLSSFFGNRSIDVFLTKET